jgi:hypothetical protein
VTVTAMPVQNEVVLQQRERWSHLLSLLRADRDLLVEASPLARLDGPLLADAINAAGQGFRVVVLSSKHALHRGRCMEALASALRAPKSRHSNGTWYFHSGGRLTIWDAEKVTDMPVDSCSLLVVLGCDEIEDGTGVRTWANEHVPAIGRRVWLGTTGPQHHWWRRMVEDPESPTSKMHVSADEAVSCGRADDDTVEGLRSTLAPAVFGRVHDLKHEDVSDPDAGLTDEEFCRRRLQIRDKAGKVLTFDLNSVQVRYEALKQAHAESLRSQGRAPKFLTVKYRRGGITTLEQAKSYKLTASIPNMQAVTLAHTDKATAQIFRIAQLFHRSDPRAPRLRGVGNAQRLEFVDLNSQFFIGTAGGQAFGRGDTLQRVHGSEVAYWTREPQLLISGLTEAATHGEVILESTPNGVNFFCQMYREAKAGLNDWTPIFIPWFWDSTNTLADTAFTEAEIRDTLSGEERLLMERHSLSLGQVAWRRLKQRALKSLFVQEYPEDDESCFINTGTTYFPSNVVAELLQTVPEARLTDGTQLFPHWDGAEGGYYVEWEAPQPGVEYVVGCDTSEGVGRWDHLNNTTIDGTDPNGVGVMRTDTGAQVAALHGVFTPRSLAHRAVDVCRRYNDAMLGVERNNHGHAVILQVENLGYDRPHLDLFYDHDGRAGWNTDTVSRPVLLSELNDWITERPECVRDRQMLSEMSSFKRQSTGKYEADKGFHDDTIFKWGIANQLRKQPRVVSGIITI